MDNALDLLLTLQLRSVGYESFNAVSQAINDVTGASGLLAVAAGAATLALAGLVVAGAGFVVLAEQAGQFNTVTTEVANNANMTDQQLQQMQATTLDLAKNTGLATTDITQGYMHIYDEGFNAAGATQVATAAAESAASTGAKFASVANLLATTLHIWGLNAGDAAATMDTLHVASALSNVSLDQFVQGMSRLAPIAAAGGLSIDEAAAALATMTREGFNATMAATQLKNLIQHIIAPTASAEAAIVALSKATGVDLVSDFSQTGLAVRGFTGVMEDITTATKGNINAFADLTGQQRISTDQMGLVTQAENGNLKAMQDMVPATRGLYAEFILTGSGAGDYVGILKQMAVAHEDGGVTAQNFARWEQTLGAQMTLLSANVKVAAIEVGEDFAPIVQKVVSFITDDAIPAIQMFAEFVGSKLVGMIQAATAAWNGLVSAFNSGGLLGVIQSLITTLIDFAKNMYNAGINLVEQLGQGMWDAAVSVVRGVIEGIAQMIANFFVGNSPPPDGPLNAIQTGGKNTMTAWVDGASQGLGGLQSVADSASYTLSSIGNKADFTQLTNDATQAKLAVVALKDAGADATVKLLAAKDALHSMDDDIANMKDQVAAIKDQWATLIDPLQEQADGLKFDIQNINDEYAALDQPLQTQLDDLKQAVDYNQKIADAQDQIALAQLNSNIAADQGNQLQKSQLESQLEEVRNKSSELNVEAQIADLQNKKKAAAGDPAKEQSLDLQLQALSIQKQIYDLANHPQLASDTAAKVALQQKMADEKAAANLKDLQNKQAEAVLEKQISDNKAAAAAKTLTDRTALLQVEGQIAAYKLNEQKQLVGPENALKNLQDQKQLLGDQVQQLTTAKGLIGAAATQAGGLATQLGLAASAAKGIGAGFGGGFGAAKPPDLGASFDPAAIAAAMAAKAKNAVETATADAVSKAQAAATKAIDTWVQKVSAEVAAKRKDFESALTAFTAGGYKKLEDYLATNIPKLGHTIADGISKNAPAVEKAIGDLAGKGLDALGKELSTVFSSIGTSIAKTIGPDNMKIIHDAADGFKDIGARVKAVGDVIGPVADQIQKTGDAVSKQVVPALQSMAKFLGDCFDAAVKFVGWLNDHQPALDAVKAVLLGIVGIAFSAFVWAAVGAVAAVAVATWAWVAALGAAIVAQAVALAPIAAVVLAIGGLIFIIMEVVRFWPQISSKATEIWGDVQTIVGDAVDFVKQHLDQFMQWIGPAWRGVWNDINTYISGVWGIIQDIFKTALDLINGILQLGFDVITGKFNKVGADVKAIFSTLWEDLKKQAQDELGLFGQFIKTGIDAVLALIAGFSQKWADAGKNLVDAMAGGIRDAAKAVADAAGEMVHNAINAAKGVLGIKSPSTVFVGIGQNTGEGYARGLEASASRVGAATSAMLGIPSSLSAGAVASTGGATGGVTVIISDNYILDDFAIRELADKVGQAITRSTGNSQFLARV